MKMKLFYVFFIFFCKGLSFLCASEKEEKFYVFGMGQGNSHLAIYQEIGILYDCGSSSQQIHPKMKSLMCEEYTRILSKKEKSSHIKNSNIDLEEKKIEQTKIIKDEEKIIDVLGTMDVQEQHDESNRSSESNTYSNIDSIENNIKSTIRKAINDHCLKHIFVFISHPDADHYDKLIRLTDNAKEEEILPADIHVTIILCGDWLGNLGQEKSETKKEYIGQRLIFIRRLSRRDKTWIELPYYWDYREEKNPIFFDYQSLLGSFKHPNQSQEIPTASYESFLPRFYPDNPTLPFQGRLTELILLIKQRCMNHLDSTSSSFNLLSKFDQHFNEITPNIEREESPLNNILIWLINQRFNDINSQSAIVSFIMPQIKMHFICTGDAYDETFHHSLFSTPDMHYELQRLRDENFAHILIIPHHGSSGNISRKMLEIFQPDLCLISSGNGKHHGHPNKKMIDSYLFAIEKGFFQNRFRDLFDIEGQGLFAISYTKKGETDVGYLSKFSEKNPLFSTNVHGTVKFDKSGVYSNFSNIIEIESMTEEIENQYYVVDFKQKDDKITKILNKLDSLQHCANLFFSKCNSANENIKASTSCKKRNSSSAIEIPEEISLNSLLEKINSLESSKSDDYSSYTNEDLEKIIGDKIKILNERFKITEVGKNIILFNGTHYYKIATCKNNHSNKKTKNEKEEIKKYEEILYNYYPVKKDAES